MKEQEIKNILKEELFSFDRADFLDFFVNSYDEEYIEELKKEHLEYAYFPPETRTNEVKFEIHVKINGDGSSIVEDVLESDLSILESENEAEVKSIAKKLIEEEIFYGVLATYVEKKIVDFEISTKDRPDKEFGRSVVISKLSDKIESDFYYDEVVEKLRELKPDYIQELKEEALKESGILSDMPELDISSVPDSCFDSYKPQLNCTVEDIADVLYDRYFGLGGEYEYTEEFVKIILDEGYHYKVMLELVPDKVSVELYVKEDVLREHLSEL